jgi:AcrR family transcriptional regulator
MEKPKLREQQRASIRQKIAEAACEIAERDGPEGLTADRIAALAGISRRTFFNYVSSAEAALNIPAEDFLAFAYEALPERPADEPLFESLLAIIMAPPREMVVRVERAAPFAKYQLEVWERDEVGISAVIASKYPDKDPLLVRTMAAAMMGAGRAGAAIWAQEPPETRAPINEYMVRAMRYLANLFSSETPEDEPSKRRGKRIKNTP